MNFGKTLQNRQIKIDSAFRGSSPFMPEMTLREELLLFSVSSEAFPHFSRGDVSILCGPSFIGKSLFDIAVLSDDDIELFFSLLYTSERNAALFPFGDKLLFVFTRFLRAGGPGLALIIDCLPGNASALARSDLADSLDGFIFSPSFENHLPIEDKGMELYRSVSRFVGGRTWESLSIIDLIRIAAELSSIEVSIGLALDSDREARFNTEAAFSLLLCLFSHAGGTGAKKADVTLSGTRNLCLTVEYEAADNSPSDVLLFCEKSAANMGLFFVLNICENSFKATFIPDREGPGDGFKSGIFINGKRFINPFLKDLL